MNQHHDYHHQFDISYLMETPEGVDLQVELAGPVSRVLAFAIDFSIRVGVVLMTLIVSFFAGLTGSDMAMGVFTIALFLIEWLYPVLFEFFRGGQTPGKKAMGIMVVNDDLTPITLGNAFTRNLLRAADFLPAFYFFGFVSISATRNFQRLGDIAAGTIVIYKKTQQQQLLPPTIVPQAPIFEMNEQEQAAVVEFTLRHDSLSQARQHELATILSPLLQSRVAGHKTSDDCAEVAGEEGAIEPLGSSAHPGDEQMVDRLRAMGAWFLGARR